LPPQFDLDGGSPSGDLLRARLDEFAARRPGVRLEVRVKAVDGPGGLLDSLTTASAAAPLALPDLIALPRQTLEAAALKGLLRPSEKFTEMIEDPDWYDYSRQLARLQNSTFGLPFAGDALLMVYRPAAIGEPPSDLAAALQTSSTLAFPASDPQALFTLALYQSAGGEVLDDQGRPYLDAGKLAQVLAFYQEAENSHLIPYWLTQYQTDAQAWEAFVNRQAGMVITWSSRYLNNLIADTAAAPIPTTSGEPLTLASGWVWSLAGSNPERQALAVELAEFLSESRFLARWTATAGFLPTRPSILAAWQDPPLRSLVEEIVLSAQLYPPADVHASLSPSLEQATIDVLKEQVDPQRAAEDAVDSLGLSD
jgi:ABC-type glycerol-3-phosphate transport system substrate-binding protein